MSALLTAPSAEALQALLAVTDGDLRYRSRHARGLAPLPVAELVMLDADNPRALRYQLESLVEHLRLLPEGDVLAEPLTQQLETLQALSLCDCLIVDAAGRAAGGAAEHARCADLHDFLAQTWACGNRLADALSHRYFTHLDARSRATASS